jgi:hypothetical protein
MNKCCICCFAKSIADPQRAVTFKYIYYQWISKKAFKACSLNLTSFQNFRDFLYFFPPFPCCQNTWLCSLGCHGFYQLGGPNQETNANIFCGADFESVDKIAKKLQKLSTKTFVSQYLKVNNCKLFTFVSKTRVSQWILNQHRILNFLYSSKI